MTTLATILLELSLTRIFSVVFHYHFAFLAISIALFGLGAGGLFSYAFRGLDARLFESLGRLAVVNSLCVVAMLAFVLTQHGGIDGATLIPVYLAASAPFFLAGTVVSAAIAETVERVDRVYFFDLLGAAVGCLVLAPILDFFGGPNTVINAAVLYAAASAIWFNLADSIRGRIASVAVALALVGLVAFNAKYSMIDVKYARGERLTEEQFVQWNSFSRIALAADKQTDQMTIRIDADAQSRIPRFDLDQLSGEDRAALLGAGPGLPYVLRPGARTVIIGPGGGMDVARAIAGGSRDVTGVEINPIIANTVMRKEYSEASRGLYFRPEVRIVVGDGRNYVRRSSEQAGVIQISHMETWSTAAAGALAISESNLYTVEAFGDYLRRLTGDGLISFTHRSSDPPRESLRLAAVARAALERAGAAEPWRHIVAVREEAGGEAKNTVMVARSPFTELDLATVESASQESGLEILYSPRDSAESEFALLLRGGEAETHWADYPYNVTPVDDNKPFFFYSARGADFWGLFGGGNGKTASGGASNALLLLLRLLGVSVVATAIILALPPLLLGDRLPKDSRVGRFLWYFVFVGVGYILIQLTLIQKFVFLLGHPGYALTVIIFSMLISSSAGSYFSRGVVGGSDRNLTVVLAAIALLVALLAVAIPPLTDAAASWPLWAKMASVVLLIGPAGFAMGVAFPAGLQRLQAEHRQSVRWAWALNTAASVLGSICAVLLAIHLGLRETLLIGGVMYLCAVVTIGGGKRAARSVTGL
mgnify:CR=1 FL=1